MPKRKPVVLYRNPIMGTIKVGHRAVVEPINHPDVSRVSNTGPVVTSIIERVEGTEFETQNSIYRLSK